MSRFTSTEVTAICTFDVQASFVVGHSARKPTQSLGENDINVSRVVLWKMSTEKQAIR